MMELLKCYTHEDKIRLGRDYDGGYVIVDGIKYDVLISCNIYSDNSFEKDFLKKYPNLKSYIYDVKNLNHKSILKKHINFKVSEVEKEIYKIISNNNNIFLKINIKGEEYEWFNNIPLNLLLNISQMVVVFYYPFKVNRFKVFKKINETHYLIHFHPNNLYSTKNVKNIIVPEVFECTYINKNLIPKPELNNKPIPSKLDKKNSKKNDDIYLSRYPYTFWKLHYFK